MLYRASSSFIRYGVGVTGVPGVELWFESLAESLLDIFNTVNF